MITAGLTGGIACGKSFVTKLLLEKGAIIIDLDQVAREVVKPGGEAWSDIVTFFGREFVDVEGNIDRQKLGQVVFSDEKKREKLNQITHRRIIEYVQKIKDEFYKNPENKGKVLVIDAPLLIEAGMDKMVDKVIVIVCDTEIQKKRLMERNNLSEEESYQRINAQMPLEEKARYGDYIIDNSHTREYTRKQVDIIWQKLIREMPRR
ncbi:MAG: dephospho-CoA kinase [Candidatus Syntrophonatronum acetioxidans]|uniref:Dephospho-CoA kinase n=1 Tax=Candidatus Syntrophonatronum acetioxidans TaxID=1795816 RepID=A0A424YIF8_9FIRM|nr:MAG: dephospho-CoA kinase [Candidatus Syntrophonatronum acetioxidans]